MSSSLGLSTATWKNATTGVMIGEIGQEVGPLLLGALGGGMVGGAVGTLSAIIKGPAALVAAPIDFIGGTAAGIVAGAGLSGLYAGQAMVLAQLPLDIVYATSGVLVGKLIGANSSEMPIVPSMIQGKNKNAKDYRNMFLFSVGSKAISGTLAPVPIIGGFVGLTMPLQSGIASVVGLNVGRMAGFR